MWSPKVRHHLRDFERGSYIHEDGVHSIKLNCNGLESTLPHAPEVEAFIRGYDWITNMWETGDTSYKALSEEICRYWKEYADIKEEQVKIGCGSMQVLERINKIFLDESATVLGYTPQFVEYITEVRVSGARFEAVPMKREENFLFHVDSLLGALKKEQTLLYIDNPNNPTGQLIPLDQIEALVARARDLGVVVVVDEAYGDYAPKDASAMQLISKYKNLIVTRTLTKGFHFAGTRVGYGVFSEDLWKYYDKVNLPFPVSSVSTLLAREALRGGAVLEQVRKSVGEEKVKLIAGLKERGYSVANTYNHCPILLVSLNSPCIHLASSLAMKGIGVRSGEDYPNLGKNYVRIATPSKASDFFECLDRGNH